jgi:hypothetical protein
MRPSSADQEEKTTKVDLSEVLLRAASGRGADEGNGESDHSHRSGTRPIAQEIAAAEDWTFDPHSAVTRVQQAIDLDSLAPPTVQVTVAVSGIIAVGDTSPAGADAAQMPAGADMAAASLPLARLNGERTTDPGMHAPVPLQGVYAPRTKARPRNRGRRVAAALLVVAVMSGALALLIAAVRGGHVRAPATVVRVVELATRLFR